MANQITSPCPQGNTTATSATATKPTYTPDQWERKHGKIKDGVFYKPNFVVMRNGEFINIDGSTSAYGYVTAFHIMLHLQAVCPSDNFTVEPISWQPMTDYNVILDTKAGVSHE